VVDMDSVVVHLFMPQMRAEYALEQLWGEEHGCKVESLVSTGAPPAVMDPGLLSAGAWTSAPTRPPAADDWAPLLFDRAAGRLDAYDGLPPTVPGTSRRRATAAALSSDDSDSDDEDAPDEAAVAAQAVAVARYEAAAQKHDERLARRVAVLNQRSLAASQRRAAKRAELLAGDAATQALSHARFVRQGPHDSAPVLPPPVRPAHQLCPPARTQQLLLQAAAKGGLDYGPGEGRGRHAAGCACGACETVRLSINGITARKMGRDSGPVSQTVELCASAQCGCSRCNWLRWRVVGLAQRSVAGAKTLGLANIRRGRPRQSSAGEEEEEEA